METIRKRVNDVVKTQGGRCNGLSLVPPSSGYRDGGGGADDFSAAFAHGLHTEASLRLAAYSPYGSTDGLVPLPSGRGVFFVAPHGVAQKCLCWPVSSKETPARLRRNPVRALVGR